MHFFQEKAVDSFLTTTGLSTPQAAEQKFFFFEVPNSGLICTGLFHR